MGLGAETVAPAGKTGGHDGCEAVNLIISVVEVSPQGVDDTDGEDLSSVGVA